MTRPIAVAIALFAGLTHAGGTEAISTERCRTLGDDADRLKCYDALFPRDSAATAGDSAPPLLPKGQLDHSTNENLPATEEAARTFGFSAAQEQTARHTKAIERMAATVIALRHAADGRFVVYLDNGQAWQQTESDLWTPPRQGELITIRRAALGSFMLETRENLVTHVRRIK